MDTEIFSRWLLEQEGFCKKGNLHVLLLLLLDKFTRHEVTLELSYVEFYFSFLEHELDIETQGQSLFFDNGINFYGF